jgi:hypothetical protein
MQKLVGRVIEVSLGHEEDDYCMHARQSLQAALDGLVGDRHRSVTRETWLGDKQPEGVIRRNERHWSAMSSEEMAEIATKMDVKDSLTAANLSVNFCIVGIPKFSFLPKGTTLKFPSGAELMVEEYNPPCLEMSQKLARTLSTHSGEKLSNTAFTRAATFSRGVVGVVEVAGEIKVGDEVIVDVYKAPIWYARENSPYHK